MNITVNGKVLQVEASFTVHDLLVQFELSEERIAVEYNQRILDPTEFATLSLEDGATLEVIRFVGGG